MPPNRRSFYVLALLGITTTSACKKESPPPPLPVLASSAPVDTPVNANDPAAAEKLRAAMAPYVQKARDTYPAAKKRYLAGLPLGHAFFATAQLRDGTGAIEQVYISVSDIRDGRISGRIASDIMSVRGFARSDPYSFPESELVDWLISRPDGTEEGNAVGKFLDEWQKARH